MKQTITIKNAKLPKWLKEVLPEPREIRVIAYENGEFFVKNDNSVPRTKNFQELYDNLCKDRSSGFDFDDSIEKSHLDRLCEGMYTAPQESEFTFAYLSDTDESSIKLLEYSYKEFLRLNQEYLKNREDWVLAYNWLSYHPAFWKKFKDARKFDWSTEAALEGLWTSVSMENGKVIISVECGGHVAPEFTTHYHDIRLDSYGETFEEVYVNLAKAVNKYFNSDGSEKVEVKEDYS